MSLRDAEAGAVIAVAAAAGWFIYRGYKSGALDPTSDKNIAYSAVNDAGQALTGDEDWNVGAWFYETLHPFEPGVAESVRAENPLGGGPLIAAGRRTIDLLRSGAGWIVDAIGGDSDTETGAGPAAGRSVGISAP